MIEINLTPLSTNGAWTGKKKSTRQKRIYEAELREAIENLELEDSSPPFLIHFRFHVIKMQDYDNCIKVTQDVLCEHFGINDRDILFAVVEKIPVKPGQEKFEVEIESMSKRKFYFLKKTDTIEVHIN